MNASRSSMLPANASIPPDSERSPTVLVVGELGASPAELAMLLAPLGCEVLTRATGDDILAALRDVLPDLLLLDVRLHGRSAFELCGEVRSTELGRETPIVLFSTQPTTQELAARALLCGADDFFSFAGSAIELQARVRVQLRNKRDRDRLQRLYTERNDYRRQAVLDPLTGIPNRRSGEAWITAALAAGLPFAVLFFDVDHFKRVNDGFGHDVGDAVLKVIARTLAERAGTSGMCARFGGEEFVMAFPCADEASAWATADGHRRAIAALPPKAMKLPSPVTVSVGAALFDAAHGKAEMDELCRRADAALYQAKRLGRNRVVVARGPTTPSLIVPGVPLEAALLQRLATGVAGLPVLPHAAAEALRLAENPRTSMAEIARLVDRDPGMAARFVSLASSAAYARGTTKIASTQGALVRIGLGASRDLLLQVAYERSMTDLPLYQAEVAASFAHSVQTAKVARMIVKAAGLSYEYAYLCGLLHDLGEARIYRILAGLPTPPRDDEHVKELVHKHHTRAGADVARAWRLPNDIVEACATHHSQKEGLSLPARIVRASEAVIEWIDGASQDVAQIAAVGVPIARVDEIVAGIEAALAAERDTEVPAASVTVRPSRT